MGSLLPGESAFLPIEQLKGKLIVKEKQNNAAVFAASPRLSSLVPRLGSELPPPRSDPAAPRHLHTPGFSSVSYSTCYVGDSKRQRNSSLSSGALESVEVTPHPDRGDIYLEHSTGISYKRSSQKKFQRNPLKYACSGGGWWRRRRRLCLAVSRLDGRFGWVCCIVSRRGFPSCRLPVGLAGAACGGGGCRCGGLRILLSYLQSPHLVRRQQWSYQHVFFSVGRNKGAGHSVVPRARSTVISCSCRLALHSIQRYNEKSAQLGGR